MPKPLVAIKFFSGDYMDNILLDALTKIAEGTYPCTSQEAFIFTDIAQNIAREAVEKFNSAAQSGPTNTARQCATQICPKCGNVVMRDTKVGYYNCLLSTCGWSGKLLPY